MSDSITVDAARLPLLLGELRLPTVAKLWQTFTERADREGWPSARLLATLAEFELAERAQRRVQRHLLEARLPSGKTLDQNPPPHVTLQPAHVAQQRAEVCAIDRHRWRHIRRHEAQRLAGLPPISPVVFKTAAPTPAAG